MTYQWHILWRSSAGKRVCTKLDNSTFLPFVRDTLFEGLVTGILAGHGNTFCFGIMPENRFLCQLEPREYIVSAICASVRMNGQTYEKFYGLSSLSQIATMKCSPSLVNGSGEQLEWEFHAQAQSESFDDQEISGDEVVFESEELELNNSFLQMVSENCRLDRPPGGASVPEWIEPGTQILFNETVLDSIRRYSRANGEKEVVGLLLGTIGLGDSGNSLEVRINDQREARLADSGQCQVTITGEAWQDLLARTTFSTDRMLVGIWHSHPASIWSGEKGTPRGQHRTQVCMASTPSQIQDSEALQHSNISSTLFLSSQDLFLHRHVLSWPYQVSLVVDPGAEDGQDIGLWGWNEAVVCRKSFGIVDMPEIT